MLGSANHGVSGGNIIFSEARLGIIEPKKGFHNLGIPKREIRILAPNQESSTQN